MNEVQARHYLASLAQAPGLETDAAIGVVFDECRVEFTPAPGSLTWRCRVFRSGAGNLAGMPGLQEALLGMLLEANAMGRAAAFAVTETNEVLLRGGTMLSGLTEDMLAAQLTEFIDDVEYWQQQLAALAG